MTSGGGVWETAVLPADLLLPVNTSIMTWLVIFLIFAVRDKASTFVLIS